MGEEVAKINRLRYILNKYRDIPNSIARKQKILKAKLVDPSISAMKGFQVFKALEGEIEYLEKLYSLITYMLNRMSEREQKICEGLMLSYNTYRSAEVAGFEPITMKSFYRAVERICDYFEETLTTENIYNFKEEIEEEYEKE